MADLILLPLAFFGIALFLGYSVIVHCRQAHRDVLLPAAPVVGVAFLVVVLTTTSWFMSAGAGAVVVIVLALVSVTIAIRRRRRSWTFAPRALVLAGIAWLVGLFGATLAMVPNVQVGDSGVVMGSSNHDALYYTSVAGFLADHPILPLPVIGTSPDQGLTVPAFGSAAFAFTYPLRVGQSMAHAALTRVVGSDVMTTTMPVLALWVLILPGAAYTTLRLLRARPVPALAGSVGVGLSALLIFQVVNQNMDSLLGVSLATMTIGGVVAAAQGRIPRLCAAVVLAALIASYTEYVLFVVPAVGAGVLIYRSHHYLRNVVRAAQVVAVAVVIAPTAWYRGAIQVSNFAGSGGDSWSSPFFPDDQGAWINHLLGASPLTTATPVGKAALMLSAFIAVGCLLAVMFSRNRGVWIGLLVVGVGYAVNLTLGQKGYTQFRTVILLAPLILVATAAGYDAWLAYLARRKRTGARITASVILVGVLLGWVFVNVRTVRSQVDPAFAASRHIGNEYQEAVQWVSDLGGPEGQDITVLAPDFVQNIALNLVLRDFDQVSYPMENANYLHVGEFWDGRDDNYLLVGSGTQFDVDPSAIVRRNDKFTLIDRRVPDGTVIAPMDLTGWNWFVQPDGSFLGGYGSELLVVQSDHTRTAFVELAATGADQPIRAELRAQDLNMATEATLQPAPVPVPLPDVADPSFIVVIDRPAGVPAQNSPQIVLSHSQDTAGSG